MPFKGNELVKATFSSERDVLQQITPALPARLTAYGSACTSSTVCDSTKAWKSLFDLVIQGELFRINVMVKKGEDGR